MRNVPGTSPQTLQIEINGYRSETVSLQEEMRDYSIPIPRRAFQRGKNELTLNFRYAISPKEVGENKDSRPLSVAFARFGLLPEDLQEAANSLYINPTSRFDGEFVSLNPGETLSFSLDSIPEVAHITCTVVSDGTESPSALSMVLFDEETGARKNATIPVSQPSKNSRSLPEARIELGAFSEHPCTVSLRADHRTHDPIRLGNFILRYRDRKPAQEERGSSAKNLSGSPNLVMILLDAARPDHMGIYGYPKDTTPHIDAWAGKSRIFTNAVATAPYTVNSVATIVTGLSFFTHGVVDLSDRLSSEALTIAEYLHHAGYETVAFSSTPNNSPSKGFGQGFDRFYEVWKGQGGLNGHDPGLLCREVEQWIDTRKSPSPFFLLIHMVPPHSPYSPPPEHDLFGSPDFQGTLTGDRPTLEAIAQGRKILSKEEKERIISLYDGNLHWADAAVGTLLSTLESRGLAKTTLTVLTADHGEAFFEHGSTEHNTTLYEEMIHIPLIIRVPDQERSEPSFSDDLVSTLDLSATLAAAAGLPPLPGTDGRNILQDPLPERNSYSCLMRSAGNHPWLGFRTPCWSLLLSPDLTFELYHLKTDPYQETDLSVKKQNILRSLLIRFHTSASIVPPRFDGGTSPPPDEETQATLRSLGYLQ